ncbi:MAG: methylmalonyl-CoA mutase [Flavobacteriaceae bacterium]|nr:methylmalonyl-CoA mutase subunit beta [Bacteroidia bacterium]MBT8286995.1 methylmalonyl-CoA mutase subunit beta [Bacteroidia bacterium]NNF75824.1 methylmalonyl-CoA mutase [Flavobacteriaceae bacterium]
MKNKLFNEFTPVSPQAWKQKIQFDLKGGDYNQELVWTSAEGIHIKPFYTEEDRNDSLFIPQRKAPFKISQVFYAQNVVKTIESVLNGIENGLDHVKLYMPEGQETGLKEILNALTDRIDNVLIEFEKLPNHASHELRTEFDFSKSDFEIDIIGHLAKSGNWYYDLKTDHKLLNDFLEANESKRSIVAVGMDIYQNAGANMVQQLAYGLGHINEYLNHYGDLGKSVPIFNVSVGTNYFFEIAKLRALRALWFTLAKEFDANRYCNIVATPTKRNKTIYDYNNNMLRTTTECMSAINGGADIISNFPYDGIYHKSNEFGNRIARNQPLILKHESYFNAANNPADGSYYIEALTDALASEALKVFKDMEANGGFLQQLKSGTIQRKIKESAEQQQNKFNNDELILLGINKFPNTKDKMKNDLELYPFVQIKKRKTLIEPIIAKRLAETLEKERLNNE